MANERDIEMAASEFGRMRRARMRDELLAELLRVRRSRRRRRRALAASFIVLIVGGLWLMHVAPHRSPSGTSPQVVQAPSKTERHRDDTAAKTQRRVTVVTGSVPLRVTRIECDETILDRYRASEAPLRHVTPLTDEQLVRELAAIGEPASVIRLSDRVLLVRAEPRVPATP